MADMPIIRPRYDTCLPPDMVEESISQIEVQVYSRTWGEDEFIRRTVTVGEFLDLADDHDEAWERLCDIIDSSSTVDEWEDDFLYVYWSGPGMAEAMGAHLDQVS